MSNVRNSVFDDYNNKPFSWLLIVFIKCLVDLPGVFPVLADFVVCINHVFIQNMPEDIYVNVCSSFLSNIFFLYILV